MEILTKENLVHCSFQSFRSLTKGNKVSLMRIHLSHPESDGKSSDVGVGGWIGILILSGRFTLQPENITDINVVLDCS